MPRVTYIQADGQAQEINLEVGSSLMQGAVDNMIDGIVAECGGSCSCATCASSRCKMPSTKPQWRPVRFAEISSLTQHCLGSGLINMISNCRSLASPKAIPTWWYAGILKAVEVLQPFICARVNYWR